VPGSVGRTRHDGRLWAASRASRSSALVVLQGGERVGSWHGPRGARRIEAFERHQTPIVVITISHKGEYGGWSHSIEIRYSFGNLRGMRCPQGGEAVSTCATSTRFNLGASWYPRSTR